MLSSSSPPHLGTLILASSLAVLSVNMFLPSLPVIAVDLEANYALVNLSIAGYLGISAFLQLIMGPLSDRYGRCPIMLICMGLFTVSSVGCALADTIWVFLAFRMIQGAVIAGQVLSRAVIRDMYEPGEAASKLGYVSMAMALAPMLGPMLGGALEMLFGWRAGFVLYAVMGLILLALLGADLGETNQRRSSTFAAQFRQYPFLFASRRFWGYAMCAAFSIGAFYTFITGAPLVAAAWFDLSPAELGLGIGIITLGFMGGNFITGRIAARTELSTMILYGRICASVAPALALGLFLAGLGNVWIFFGAAVLVGFGNGLTVANATTGLMSVRPQLAGSASGLSGAMTVALGAVLTSGTGALADDGNAPYLVLAMMAGSSFLGLLSILYVRRVDRQEPLNAAI